MSDKYDEIRANVTRLLAAASVSFSIRYVGETEKPDGGREKPWKCDAWRFTFKSGTKEYSGDYFTGLGHRAPPAGPKPRPPYTPGTLAHEDYQRTFKPVAPHAADVLHSLALDSTAEDMNFRDWASELGYSDDSIRALEIYRQCCNVGADLRRVFARETLEQLRAAVEEL